jgi:hypothetical protein
MLCCQRRHIIARHTASLSSGELSIACSMGLRGRLHNLQRSIYILSRDSSRKLCGTWQTRTVSACAQNALTVPMCKQAPEWPHRCLSRKYPHVPASPPACSVYKCVKLHVWSQPAC